MTPIQQASRPAFGLLEPFAGVVQLGIIRGHLAEQR
jgi:hypothetical protein